MKACLGTGASPPLLNSKLVIKLKLLKVKGLGLPIRFFDQVKCPEQACSVTIAIAGRAVMVQDAVIDNPNFEKNCLLGNDLLDLQKVIVDFRFHRVYFLDKGPCKSCLGKTCSQLFSNSVNSSGKADFSPTSVTNAVVMKTEAI